jgi:hypothetical protein
LRSSDFAAFVKMMQAMAARWVDRSAFNEGAGFVQAHQALLKALEKAGRFV